MKKITNWFFMVYFILLSPTSSFGVCGDVNMDGKTSPTDALIVLQEANGINTGKCINSNVVKNNVGFFNVRYISSK